MRKSTLLIIISAFIIVFIGIMQSGKVIKIMGGEARDLSRNVKELMDIIKEENWQEAHKKSEEVDRIFKQKSKWLQISEERDRLDEIARELGITLGADQTSRLNGTVGGEMTRRLVELGEKYYQNTIEN